MNKIFFLTTLIGLFFNLSASALCANVWYNGRWNCSIDGRPSKMVWEVKAESQQNCYDSSEGRICTRTDDICKIYGWFKEDRGGGNWFHLNINRTNPNELFFTYTGDNTPWYLRATNSTKTQLSGHTTWQGHTYPLTCTK